MSAPRLLQLLLSQYDFGVELLLERVNGMSDEEYLWEPVPGCWSLRRRDDARSSAPLGKGDWVLDFARPEPDPPPFTTIAWRMTHLASGLQSRADYTIGSRSLTPHDLEVPVTAADATAILDACAAQWRGALESAGEDELEQVGYSQLPWGLDLDLPFIDIVWWVNKEVLHHGAEIALLRDLYRASRQSRS